jgi:hypothetical protein
MTTTAPKPKRSRTWDTRELHNFFVSRASTPYAWGTHDCALFCADGIQAMTGVDIAADFRNTYTDEASALASIAKVTGIANGTVEDAAAYCATKHGLTEWKNPLYAQRGDLVIVEHDGTVSAGLVHLTGRHVAVAGEKGLKKILIHDGKTSPIRRAWHV